MNVCPNCHTETGTLAPGEEPTGYSCAELDREINGNGRISCRNAPATIKRNQAAELLRTIAVRASQALAKSEPAGNRSEALASQILGLLALHGIQPARQCEGEAHSNPYVDNCPQCAPHWEWIAPKVRIP